MHTRISSGEGSRAGVVVLILLAALLCLPGLAAGVTVTIQPSNGDTMLDEIAPTTNSGTATTIQVRSQNGSRDRRIILKFDLSQIPASATISSANLELYMTAAPGNSRTYDAHRITQDWNETQATWNQRVTGTNWTTAGGTYNGTATGSTTTGTTSGVWRTWSITADVQAWVNGTQSNYGTLIKDRTENSGTAYTATFASEENGTTGNRPRLVVTYQPAFTVTLPGGSAAVMAEPTLLNFTVSNIDQSPATETISNVTMVFGYPVSATVPPPGWKQTSIDDIFGFYYVRFDTVETDDPGCSSASLGNGQSAVFGIYVTATAAAAETTDALSAFSSAANDCNTPGTNAYSFTRAGSLPSWTRRGLGSSMVATPVTLGVGGTITVTHAVTNRTTGTQNAVTPTTNPTVTGTGTVTKLSGPTPASANLASGAVQDFVYTYQATGVGNVTFTANAANGTVQSINATSNAVEIGNLTAALSVTPSSQTSGNQVTVTMSVTNNGASTLSTITPSALTLGGTATKTLVSGPTPASVASLAPGDSTAFSWTYTVTGTAGQTYSFSGSASASGGTTSNTATSNVGWISSVSMSVSPSSIPTTQGATLTYTVNNDSGRAFYRVEITFPAGFTYSSASPPSGWTATLNSDMVRFESGAVGTDLASGSSGDFGIVYSAAPGTAGTYAFPGNFVPRDNILSSASATVSVNQYAINISASPTTIAGDAASTSAITATLTSGGSPVSGATITFSKTIGTLSTTTATTNASGQATTTLTSAAVGTNQVSTVTATYGAGTSANVNVTFEGVVLAVAPSPTTVAADGQSTSTITATLTKAGAAWSGRAVTLSATAGTLGTSSGTTNGSGQLITTLTAPVSESDIAATVTAGYLAPTFTANAGVTFQRVVLTISASPTTIAADGESTSTITLTLTQGGAALSGATITLSTSAGSLSPTSVITNASGQATATLTASASETDVTATVTATYKGHQKNTNVTFQRVVLTVNASPTTIPADGSSTSAISITLTQGGSALSGATIGFSTSAGSIAPGSTTTNGSGQATATLTASSSATDVTATVTVTYKGVTKQVTVTFAGIALSLTAAPLSIPADGATTSTLTATLTAGGSPLSGKTVDFTTTGGTLSAGSAVTNASGQASVTLRSTVASKSTSTPTVTAAYSSLSSLRSVTLTGITIAEVTELNVVSGGGTNTMYWTWPGAGFINGVLVLRRAAGTPQVPADGVVLNVGDTLADGSRVVAKVASGGTTSGTDSGLTAGTTYYYRAFGYFTSGVLYSTAGLSLDAPGTGAAPGQPQWVHSSSASGMVDASVDGSGGVVWGGPGGGLMDVSLSTGTRLWSPALAGTVVGGPLALTEIPGQSGWYAIVGTQAGTVAAVDLVNGAVLWETSSLGNAIGSAMALQYGAYSDSAYQALYGTSDLVIVGTKNASATNNQVYGLDASNGAVLWTFNAAGGTAVDQVTGWGWVDHAQNRVLVTTKSNGGTQPSLWALSTLNGTVVQSWALGDVTAWLSMAMDGGVYVATAGGKLYELDLATLGWKWTGPFDFGASNGLVGWVWEDWGEQGTLYVSTSSGDVWKLAASGGTAPPSQVWRTAVAGASAPAVLVDQGLLWVGSSDGKVHQLRLSDGVDEKQVTVGGGSAAVGTPTWDVGSGWLYVGTAAGKVFAIPTPLP